MKLPPLKIPDDGMHRGQDLLGHTICLGARRGIPDRMPLDPDIPAKLRLVRLRLIDGGCYAPNGAYFGQGEPLYHAESVEEFPIKGSEEPDTIRLFRRVASRRAAKELIRKELPNAKFYR